MAATVRRGAERGLFVGPGRAMVLGHCSAQGFDGPFRAGQGRSKGSRAGRRVVEGVDLWGERRG